MVLSTNLSHHAHGDQTIGIQDMDFASAYSCFNGFPRTFVAKNRQALRMQLLDNKLHQKLVETYLNFHPRNSFQGLPPLKDRVCVKWVEGIIETGLNIVATLPTSGIIGHTSLLPIDDRKCEMLVVVWPEFQNIGIGTELTKCCVEMANKLGFGKIWIPVDATNLKARHIYLKCGFEYVSHKHSRELEMVCLSKRGRVKSDNIVTFIQYADAAHGQMLKMH